MSDTTTEYVIVPGNAGLSVAVVSEPTTVPPDHAYIYAPTPPLAWTTMSIIPPWHTEEVPVMVAVGTGLTTTLAVSVLPMLQPGAEFETVTEYTVVMVGVAVIAAVVFVPAIPPPIHK